MNFVWLWSWMGISGCWQGDVYIVQGTVVSVGEREVTVDHEPIEGLMDAMVMPFPVADPALLQGVQPGDRIIARYELTETAGHLIRLRVTGHGPPPQVLHAADDAPMPVRVGQSIAEQSLTLHDGTTLSIGPSQRERIALTFIYTRCPQPEFCPAMIARLQQLQTALNAAPPPEISVRIVAVTLDPAHDTTSVLADYATAVGAGERWQFARAEGDDALFGLAMRAGLSVMRAEPTSSSPEIAHGLRLLILDAGGSLIERYDDARFPLQRVVSQLTTGQPAGDPDNSGTITPIDDAAP